MIKKCMKSFSRMSLENKKNSFLISGKRLKETILDIEAIRTGNYDIVEWTILIWTLF